MKKIIAFLLIAVSFIGSTSCDSHSGKIDKIKETLLGGGKVGIWRISYDYYFVDDIVLKAVETMMLKENGEFIEETFYYSNGDPLAKGTMTGEWDIEFDDDLDAYFFIQNYDDKFAIQNLNMNEDWFKRFDTDLRLTIRGDAYDALKEVDNNTLHGIEIIDCNENLLLLKSLALDIVFRYEPVKKIAKKEESFENVSSSCAQEGDLKVKSRIHFEAKLMIILSKWK